MWCHTVQPILAFGFDDIGTIIAIVIGLIVWLFNVVNQKKQPPPPVRPQRKPAQRPAGADRLSNEIDRFLREVGGAKQAGGRKPQQEPSDIELVEEVVSRKPPPPRRNNPQPRPPRRVATTVDDEPPKRRRKPLGSEITQRHISDPNELGSEVREHLSDYMEDSRIDESVESHLGHNISESVAQHLGTTSTKPTSENRPSTDAAQNIVALLQNPAGVRQAILLSEVLSPPLASRQKR